MPRLRSPRWPCVHEEQRADDCDRHDDHVDPERPPPRVVGGEEAADHRAERDADARGRTPHRERGAAFPAAERAREDRERRRHHQRRADALDDRFAEHELGHRLRDGGDERSQAEQRGADDEDAAVAVHVAEPSADDQQRRERERVAGDDPLQRRQGGVELAQDGRDRDVQHRVVEHHDERGEDDDREREPAARVGVVVRFEARAGDRRHARVRGLRRRKRRSSAKSSGRPGSGDASTGRRPSSTMRM